MALSSYQQVQQVKDHYNTISGHFAQTRKKKLWPEILPFIKLIKTDMKVLDIGCGSGRLLTEIKHKRISYLGLDFSKNLLNLAKKRFQNRRFLLRDITTPKGWHNIGQYDVIFCLGVLHHIPDQLRQHRVLQYMYEHTKPGGFIIISVWNLWQIRFWKYHLRQIKNKFKYGNPSYVWIPYLVSDGTKVIKKVNRFCKAYYAGELIQLVRQAGFKIDTFYYASQDKTHQSIFTGRNFCLLARKGIIS